MNSSNNKNNNHDINIYYILCIYIFLSINKIKFSVCEYLLEKSKIFNHELMNKEDSLGNIQDEAKYIISHLSKFDLEKTRLYIEDLRLFFNVHNHPEIKIIGKNLPDKNSYNDLYKRNSCLLQNLESHNNKNINYNNSKFSNSNKKDNSRSLEDSNLISSKCKNLFFIKYAGNI